MNKMTILMAAIALSTACGNGGTSLMGHRVGEEKWTSQLNERHDAYGRGGYLNFKNCGNRVHSIEWRTMPMQVIPNAGKGYFGITFVQSVDEGLIKVGLLDHEIKEDLKDEGWELGDTGGWAKESVESKWTNMTRGSETLQVGYYVGRSGGLIDTTEFISFIRAENPKPCNK